MKLEHNINNMRASQIVLELQKCEKFPVEIVNGADTMTINNENDAHIVAIGMLMIIEMMMKEEYS